MPTATIHTTSCGRYVVQVDAPRQKLLTVVCRSLREARDAASSRGARDAVFAQRVVFDEMIGLPADETVTYTPVQLGGQ